MARYRAEVGNLMISLQNVGETFEELADQGAQGIDAASRCLAMLETLLEDEDKREESAIVPPGPLQSGRLGQTVRSQAAPSRQRSRSRSPATPVAGRAASSRTAFTGRPWGEISNDIQDLLPQLRGSIPEPMRINFAFNEIVRISENILRIHALVAPQPVVIAD